MITACKRPYYLEPVLRSWAAVRGIEAVPVTIALGESRHHDMMIDVIGHAMPSQHVRILPDKVPGFGLHAAIADGISSCFEEPETEFVIASEEDVVVGDDTLEYFRWAAAEFASDERVLAVLAHNPGGQGWDEHTPAQDADAAPDAVRLLPYFNAWGWGTWRDRWEKVLEPAWDRACTSGGPRDSGYDWHIATRIIPQGYYLCVVPEASRTQNIGRAEGWASTEESFAFSQSQSFRESRPTMAYRVMV